MPGTVRISPHLLFDGQCRTAFLAYQRNLGGTLAAGGEVLVPFEPTFWPPGFGVLVGQYGIPWEINTGQPTIGVHSGKQI